MDLYQVIYTSQPFGYDSATIGSILIDARKLNLRDGITGALICRNDVYMQLLEGPKTKVEATVARIARDDRHAQMVLHVKRPITQRLFPEWAMLHDPAVSWIWPIPDVAAGAIDRATPDEVLAFFTRLSHGAADSDDHRP